jgi:hypothetical protein
MVIICIVLKKDVLRVITFGGCLVAISATAAVFGNIVAGPRGFRKTLSREKDSKSFWGFTILYFLIGIAATTIGLLQAGGVILR